MSLTDTGAFNASAISWAFALTLALLVRIVLKASLRLFCLPCMGTTSLPCLLAHIDSLSLRSCDPLPGEVPCSNGNSRGLGRLPVLRPRRSPSGVCVKSDKLGGGAPIILLERDREAEDEERRLSVLVEIMVDMLGKCTGPEILSSLRTSAREYSASARGVGVWATPAESCQTIGCLEVGNGGSIRRRIQWR